MVTGSMLYDFVRCPHKVWRDKWGPMNEKSDEKNSFLQLLWEKGVLHEAKVIANIWSCLDLSEWDFESRKTRTKESMNRKEPLIYQGIIEWEDLLGIPDLLRFEPDGTYIPVDIKSGLGFEGVDEEEWDDWKPKKHYAVQLALYVEILRRNEYLDKNKACIIDITGKSVDYPLDEPQWLRTPQTWWEYYQDVLQEVRALLKGNIKNKPAYSSMCKLCAWYWSCKNECETKKDLSLVSELGRSKRDVIEAGLWINTVEELANLDRLVFDAARDAKAVPGLGEKTIEKLMRRADMLHRNTPPVLLEPVSFPDVEVECFFDIEDDPTQNFVYMHRVYERRRSGEMKYIPFVAIEFSPEAEKEAWANFWNYIHSLPKNDFSVYYYSHHEKSTYGHMRKRYPDVIGEIELENFFENENVIDLYKIVRSKMDWPLYSYSIKYIATYLGFKWRDETPSGALSIQWYNEFLKTWDQSIMQRILDYNEDDCRATMVLKDGIMKL